MKNDKVIAIANQKGGVTKTTSALAFAAYLTKIGKDVLTIDLDQQGSFSKRCGATDGLTTYELMDAFSTSKPKDIKSVPAHIESFGDVVIGDMGLSNADGKFTRYGREKIIKRVLEEVHEEYDYILIDCPPALGVLSYNAIAAADAIIVPTTAEPQSIDGMEELWDTIATAKKMSNTSLYVASVLVCRYDSRTNSGKRCLEALKASADEMFTTVCDTIIPVNVAVNEAQEACRSLFDYAPECKAAIAYEKAIKSILGV